MDADVDTLSRMGVAVIMGFIVVTAVAAVGRLAIRVLVPSAFPDVAPPSDGWLVVALLYSTFGGVAGGFVTKRAAREWGSGALLTLAFLLIVLGVARYAIGMTTNPTWYQLASLVLAPAAVVTGGRMAMLVER